MTEFPDELIQDALALLEKAKMSGRIKKGTNEVTKAIERGTAKLVFIGEDVSPPEIIRHLPILSKEKNTPYIRVPSASSLGAAAGLEVSSASTAIIDAGDANNALTSIVERVKEFN
jgi:large subunit ribosomal protein L7Ae